MNSFSISQLQQYSGIKAHTIRIWEQRYQALQPNRTEGNTRFYDGEQLRRLLNIVSLMNRGYKISELSSMADTALFELLDTELQEPLKEEGNEYFISQLIAAGMAFDESAFEKIFSTCLLRLGVKGAYEKVVYPMLSRIGLMWTSDRISTAREHFISNILRQKFFTALDALPAPKADTETWLLFLPEGEFHEIGLLLANYLIRQAGHKVVYLGSNLPLQQISTAAQTTGATRLLFFWVHTISAEDAREYMKELKLNVGNHRIYFSGSSEVAHQLEPEDQEGYLYSIEALERALIT